MDKKEIKKYRYIYTWRKRVYFSFYIRFRKIFTGFGESMCGKSRGTDYHTGTPSCK